MNYQQRQQQQPQFGYVNKGTIFQTKRSVQLHHQQQEIDDDNSDGTNNNNNQTVNTSGKNPMPKTKICSDTGASGNSNSSNTINASGAKTATILVSKTKTKTGLPLLLKNSNN